MAEPLLDRIRTEIRARLRQCEAAALEYARLEAALVALGDVQGPTSTTPRISDAPASPSARRASKPRTTAGRAPRGANRAAVLSVLGDRPGVSAAELSSASGVARPVLYSLLKTLETRGEIAREQLPGGTTGYRLAPGAAAEPVAAS
ncbi:helix-turn-helix domain-containing protein [Candidatus Solirubrobacter pratensis]|uniref:helix-turn-helix domain-containing protein n=1 Tax=Candidatus Solirubrobacter pratensis TaxID=1298857 RepID=UPI000411A615|nr:helix-turn-helix domain-containing protein [Candidatus Solirubrobacter pratensis]